MLSDEQVKEGQRLLAVSKEISESHPLTHDAINARTDSIRWASQNIEALLTGYVELQRENAVLRKMVKQADLDVSDGAMVEHILAHEHRKAEARVKELQAQLDALRQAAEPFSALWDAISLRIKEHTFGNDYKVWGFNDIGLTLGDLHRLAEAVTPEAEPQSSDRP